MMWCLIGFMSLVTLPIGFGGIYPAFVEFYRWLFRRLVFRVFYGKK